MCYVGAYDADRQYAVIKVYFKIYIRYGVFDLSSFKNKKAANDYQLTKSDVALYKMVGVFALASIFVLLGINMQNSRLERASTGRNITHNFYEFCRTPWFWVLAVIVVMGSAGWFVLNKVKKADESLKIFSSTNCLSIAIYLLFFTLCFGVYPNSTLHGFFIVVTIAAAAIYYISKFYKADFIFYSAVTAVMSVFVYLWAQNFDVSVCIAKTVVILACAAACVMFKLFIANLKISRKRKTAYLVFPSYISAVLGAVFLFWRYFTVNSPVFLTLSNMLTVMLVQYIVFAIVYTIRLIRD